MLLGRERALRYGDTPREVVFGARSAGELWPALLLGVLLGRERALRYGDTPREVVFGARSAGELCRREDAQTITP